MSEVYGRKRWGKAQLFAAEFWDIWKSQYLSTITKRQWREQSTKNIQIGDPVALVESSLPRGCCQTGLVEDVHTGFDGMVRSVILRLTGKDSVRERPIQKLVLLRREKREQ